MEHDTIYSDVEVLSYAKERCLKLYIMDKNIKDTYYAEDLSLAGRVQSTDFCASLVTKEMPV